MTFLTDPIGRLAVGAVDFLLIAGVALVFLEGTAQLLLLGFAPLSGVATVVMLQYVAGQAREAEEDAPHSHTGPER